MPLKVNGDAVVRIRDIATLRQTFKDAESYARINGQPAVALEVSKRTGENIIDTIEKVRAVVEPSARADWPPQVQVTYSQDRSERHPDMLHGPAEQPDLRHPAGDDRHRRRARLARRHCWSASPSPPRS